MKLTPARHYALWQLMLLALIVPVLIALLLLPGRDLLTTTDVAMLQLLWVTWMAQQAGQRWAVITTVNSVLLLDWFFVEPYNTLYVHQIDYLITFIVMLLLGSMRPGDPHLEAILASEEQLRQLSLWGMGSLGSAEWSTLSVALVVLPLTTAWAVRRYKSVGAGLPMACLLACYGRVGGSSLLLE